MFLNAGSERINLISLYTIQFAQKFHLTLRDITECGVKKKLKKETGRIVPHTKTKIALFRLFDSSRGLFHYNFAGYFKGTYVDISIIWE